MEGFWSGGKWMPGELYWFINMWTIRVENSSRTSSGKITGRPWFRDLEWEKGYLATELFGFSGFSGDEEFTCDIRFHPDNIRDNIEFGVITPEEAYRRKFMSVDQYLQRPYLNSAKMGKPLYMNPAQNNIDIESRGGGKSFFASSLIGHNFILDGAHDYDAYLKAKRAGKPLTSETLVGAYNTTFSWDLLNKFLLGKKHLPGGYSYRFQGKDIHKPSPLDIATSGTLEAGNKPFVSLKSGSLLHHRSFHDNPTAGNGTRCSKVFLEEVGFMPNLPEAIGALKDTMLEGMFKFGCAWMFGTGGQMESGASLGAKRVFENPGNYDCKEFEDTYEGRGKIGYFVPVEKAVNTFKKGPDLVTDMDMAKRVIDKTREDLKSKDELQYSLELQNRPRIPSEAFLDIQNNRFPTSSLDEARKAIQKNPYLVSSIWRGHFYRNMEGEFAFRASSKKPLWEWPYTEYKERDVGAEILVMPKENSGDRYIAGLDPVDDDEEKGSLQSLLIFDMYTERIVVDYTARTHIVEDFWENTRLLLMAYNARVNYENQKKGFYGHMKRKGSLQYLEPTLDILIEKDMATGGKEGNKGYGTWNSPAVAKLGRDTAIDWMKKQAWGYEDGVTNASVLRFMGIINECINFGKGNFDRVSALEQLFLLYADRLAKMGVDSARESLQNRPAPPKDDYFDANWEIVERKLKGNHVEFSDADDPFLPKNEGVGYRKH